MLVFSIMCVRSEPRTLAVGVGMNPQHLVLLRSVADDLFCL